MENQKKPLSAITLILIGVAISVLLLVVAIVSTDKKAKEVVLEQNVIDAISSSDSAFKVYRTSFIEGCKEGGGNTAYCNCNIKYLEDNYSKERIIDFSVKYYKDKVIPQEMIDAVVNCLSLYK
jgi:hypothetical protein